MEKRKGKKSASTNLPSVIREKGRDGEKAKQSISTKVVRKKRQFTLITCK